MSTETEIRDALQALADEGGAPDDAAAWRHISAGIAAARHRTARRRIAWGVGAAVVASAAAAVITIGLDDGGRQAVEFVPPATEAPSPTTALTQEGQPIVLPEHPVAVAFAGQGAELQLYDGDTGRFHSGLTRAGEGRPETAEAYKLGEVAIGAGAVWFTEFEGPEDFPSVWRFDLTTLERTMIADGAASPAISPDGTRLAYVERAQFAGVVMPLVIRDLATGEEQRFTYEPIAGGEPFPDSLSGLAWSPDGTQLLFTDSYEQSMVGILDPSTDTFLSDATFLPGELEGAGWIDDGTVIGRRFCCYPEYADDPALVTVAVDTATVTVAGGDPGHVRFCGAHDGRVLRLESQQYELGDLVLPTGEVVANVVAAAW